MYSTKNPEGIDITPYAKKNEKGRKAAMDKLKLNALIMSGTSGPMIFVKNEITKKTNKIIPTKNLLLKRKFLLTLKLQNLACWTNNFYSTWY